VNAGGPRHLPVGPVLAATTSTQALSTMGVLALASIAPRAATDLGVNAALIGYQVGVTFLAASLSAVMAGGIVRRYGAVRASQLSLALITLGCLSSAAGMLASLVAGAVLMGMGYGLTNPAASQLLSRAPSTRGMNLIFSIKQTGVPIGGVLAGVLMPPITVALGWQWALAITAGGIAALALALERVRRAWDTEQQPEAPLLEAARSAIVVIWKHKPLRWLAAASFLYSGAQLSLSGFLVTYLVSDVGMSLVVAGTILAVTNAAGAAGRLFWGWLADRLGSGGKALMANGAMSVLFALATAALAPSWPTWAVAAVAAAFGFCAMGWNGVYIAVIARQAPAGSIGIATGGSLMVTYAGSVVIPPAFGALHERLDVSYGMGFALLSLVTALGIACVYLVRRSALRLKPPDPPAR
jgi:MFS family permease